LLERWCCDGSELSLLFVASVQDDATCNRSEVIQTTEASTLTYVVPTVRGTHSRHYAALPALIRSVSDSHIQAASLIWYGRFSNSIRRLISSTRRAIATMARFDPARTLIRS